MADICDRFGVSCQNEGANFKKFQSQLDAFILLSCVLRCVNLTKKLWYRDEETIHQDKKTRQSEVENSKKKKLKRISGVFKFIIATKKP